MRKGQLSIFFILAIIILLGAFALIYTTDLKKQFTPDVVVPPDVVPVKRYVTSCIHDAGRQGLIRMGQQGGFIEIPNKIKATPSSYIGKDRIHRIPYWHYEGETRKPTLSYMNTELEEFIRKRLKRCEAGLSQFSDTFEIDTRYNASEVSVEFGDKHTIIEVFFPIELTKQVDQQVTTIKEFNSNIPVRMRRVYKLANRTFNTEMRKNFLANVTMELMTANHEFPFTGMKFHCGYERWQVSKLKEKLKDILYYNLPRIRVDDTNYTSFSEEREAYEEISEKADQLRGELKQANYRKGDPFNDAMEAADIDPSEVPSDMYEYTHLFLDVGAREDTHGMMNERFIFTPKWDINFIPNPSRGNVMSTRMMEGAQKYLSYLCLNTYHFTYDISYPVEVRIMDPGSLPGEGGYSFSFGLPVVIQNNRPVRRHSDMQMFRGGQANSERFCTQLTDEPVSIQAKGISHGYTDRPIKGVNLSFECLGYYCELGKTRAEEGTYQYHDPIPSRCANPYIVAEKEGYLQAREQMTSDSLTIQMEKIEELNVSFRQYTYDSSNDHLSQEAAPFNREDNESIGVYVELKNETESHNQYLRYPFPKKTHNTLSFLTKGAEYNLNTLLLKEGELEGAYINENLTISYEDLVNSHEISIPIIKYKPEPTSDKEERKMMQYLYGGNYTDTLVPAFQ